MHLQCRHVIILSWCKPVKKKDNSKVGDLPLFKARHSLVQPNASLPDLAAELPTPVWKLVDWHYVELRSLQLCSELLERQTICQTPYFVQLLYI